MNHNPGDFTREFPLCPRCGRGAVVVGYVHPVCVVECRRHPPGKPHRFYVEVQTPHSEDVTPDGGPVRKDHPTKHRPWQKYTPELIAAVCNLRDEGVHPTEISRRLCIGYECAYRVVCKYWKPKSAVALTPTDSVS